MSRNLRIKKSTWLVIDETGSEGDDLPSADDDSDYEVKPRFNKVKHSINNKNKCEEAAVDIDENNYDINTNRIDKASGSRNIVRKKCSSKNDEKLLLKNEIIIDDDDDDEVDTESKTSVLDRKRKRYGCVETSVAKEITATEGFSRKTRFYVDDTESNKSKVESEIEGLKTGVQKGAKWLSIHDIPIDDKDDEDVKLESNLAAVNDKTKALEETAMAKSEKTTATSSSIKESAISKTNRNRYVSTSTSDKVYKDNDDNNHRLEHRPSRVARMKKDRDAICVIDSDELDHKTNERIKDLTGKTKTMNKGVMIIDEEDEEDEKDVKLQTRVPIRSLNKATSVDNAAEKRTQSFESTSSIKKLDETSLSRSSKRQKDECEHSDYDVEFKPCSMKMTDEIENRDKIFVIDSDESSHKMSDEDEDVKEEERITRKKQNKRNSPRKEEISFETDQSMSTSHEITIDEENEEDIQPETKVGRSTRTEASGDTAVAKKARPVAAASSMKKSAVSKTSQSRSHKPSDSYDSGSDSDYKSKHGSEKVTEETKDWNKICIIDSDESDSNINIRDKDIGAKRRTLGRWGRDKVSGKNEKNSSENDVTMSSSHEITISEEDDEDVKVETDVRVGSTKRKALDEKVPAKRIKKTQACESKSKSDDGKIIKKLSDIEMKIDDEDGGKNKPESSALVKATIKNVSTARTAAKKEKRGEDSQLKEKFGIHARNENSTVELDINNLNKSQKSNSDTRVAVEWSEADYLSEFNQIEYHIAENLVSLFKNDNTIPFIARYRKEMTGGMEPEQLRSIQNTFDNIKTIKQRGLMILKTIDKLGKWTPEIHTAVTAAKSLNELELIYAPFKPGTKGSLAERARQLGLTSICEDILMGRAVPHLSTLIDTGKKGLTNEDEVRQGIIHIIADVISKDSTTFEGIRTLRKTCAMKIESTKSKATSSSKRIIKNKPNTDLHKYENYFNFSSSERMMRDYQILAINRGESQKILSVKVVIPDRFQLSLKDHCLRKYNFIRKVSNLHFDILEESFNDAYDRLIKPLITRQVRHDLNERAESASIKVFANNLKKLLLTPPLRGEKILGIDPGFTHGCKLAIISPCGNVLDTETIYPHDDLRSSRESSARVLANMVKKHNCKIVALGNATACRETETFLTELIQAGVFAPLDISYTIVNEAGASMYSCSSEAKSEFPEMDPNIISAISIARRLQDPLAELIKVEPKHLGIGMYQHDLPKKQLQLTLDEVISETVSFVGVDVNTASHCLLTKVAGLNSLKATNIIELRNKCGFILNRQQLMDVKNIGKKTFEQCAGFIRILPETVLTGNKKSKEYPLEYLDQTWIHPESYDVAKKFLKACNCDVTQLGTEDTIRKVLSFANGNCELLAKQFSTSKTSMDIIIKGLSMKRGEDIRVKEDAPLFHKNLRCIDDLSVNTRMTGSVTNVTNFGAFVDIGVGRAGLIPFANMKGQVLSLGQRVEVTVRAVDKVRGRISLSL